MSTIDDLEDTFFVSDTSDRYVRVSARRPLRTPEQRSASAMKAAETRRRNGTTVERNFGTPKTGENHHRAKLSDADCEEIRLSRGRGATLRSISERYGVSLGYVCKLCHGKSRAP